jgi:hypothetical protein
MITDKIYRCEYCTINDGSKVFVADHEAACMYNPHNKKCGTCEHRGVVGCNVGLKLYQEQFPCAKHQLED